ncbi:MAG: GntR family transcriptional regulator [Prolixibacteraceae bacterium]|jgi:DNA-binding transcriptional regulator YhcF (GntR family)|nr:GntR family transcriptional regulator [Prolixibacteraceae bacterium]
MPDIFDHIDKNPLKSKTEKIINGIIDAIAVNSVSKGDRLPSVNKLIQRLGVSRMTVVKALNILKERGIIVSEDKVGYFIRDVNVKRELKVFLFLTGFYSYHETLYNNIIENIDGQDITVDLFFHHCNPRIFKSVLQENMGLYGLYVITGFEDTSVETLLTRIPQGKLLQIIRPPMVEGTSVICQDFYAGVLGSLERLGHRLSRFDRFILVFPPKRGHPEEIKVAFTEFCNKHNIAHSIEKKVTRELMVPRCAYWVIEDDDLIALIKLGEEAGLQFGKDIGILSYNETPMKEIIRNGITVISVDFAKMGQAIAQFINCPIRTNEIFSPDIIFRNSL